MEGGRRVSITNFELNSSDWRQLIGTWPTGRHIGFPGQLTGIPLLWISLPCDLQPPYYNSCMVRWLAFLHGEFSGHVTYTAKILDFLHGHFSFVMQVTGTLSLWISLPCDLQPPYWTNCMARWLAFLHCEFPCHVTYSHHIGLPEWSGDWHSFIVSFLAMWPTATKFDFLNGQVTGIPSLWISLQWPTATI